MSLYQTIIGIVNNVDANLEDRAKVWAQGKSRWDITMILSEESKRARKLLSEIWVQGGLSVKEYGDLDNQLYDAEYMLRRNKATRNHLAVLTIALFARPMVEWQAQKAGYVK